MSRRRNQSRIRVRIKPEFPGSVYERRALRVARRDAWRVTRVSSREDLVQDAYVIYRRVCAEYPQVDDPAWLMSLFDTALRNHIHSLARSQKRTVCATTLECDLPEGEVVVDAAGGVPANDGELLVMLEEAPEEVRQILTTVISCPGEVMDAAFDAWSARGKRKPLGNEFLCALIGADPNKIDLVRRVREYFLDPGV